MDDRVLKNDYRSELKEETHQLTIKNREETRIQGVLHVDSFDDQEIVLDTDLGSLVVKGGDLHIKQLDLQTEAARGRGSSTPCSIAPPTGAKRDQRAEAREFLKGC